MLSAKLKQIVCDNNILTAIDFINVDLPPAFGPVIIKLFLLSNKILFFITLSLSIFGCLNPFISI